MRDQPRSTWLGLGLGLGLELGLGLGLGLGVGVGLGVGLGVVLERAHLGDARAHQPRAEHADGAHRGGGLAVGVLLGGGLPEEEAAQRGRLACSGRG